MVESETTRFLNQSSASMSFCSIILFGLTFLSFFSLISPTSHADTTVSANASVNVAEACTLTSSLDTPHTATINPGTYKSDGIGQTTLSATCNDSLGYAIYAVGYTGEKIGDTNSTKLVGETSSLAIESRSTNPTSGNSNWLMKLTATGTNAPTLDNGYNDFSIVPLTYVKVAHKDSSTGSTASTLTTTYAAYINSTQAADTYIGKVKYTMVHPATGTTPNEPQTCPANRICYYPNGEGRTEGTMGQQVITSSDTSTTLLASNFSRAGYGFAGWSTTYDYSDPSGFLGPQETINFTAGQYSSTNGGLSLYAHWIPSNGNLQGWNGCNLLNQGEVTALTDKRDNQTYAVAKLADGNCWMIENLRLEANASRDETLAQGFGKSATYGNFVGLANSESANFSNSTAANSIYYSGTQEGTASINIGTTGRPGYRMPRYNNTNTSARASSPTDSNAAMYSYGNYYTWSAALANTGLYNTIDEDANGNTPSEAANTSLCPTGWRLPYGRNTGKGSVSGGFSYLDIRLGGTGANQSAVEVASQRWRKYPNNILYSGHFTGSGVVYRGSNSGYWASTANTETNAYSYIIISSSMRPGTDLSYKYSGFAVRCLFGGGV